MNFATWVYDRAQQQGWLTRQAFHTSEEVWSHGSIHSRAAQAASILADEGIRQGDRIILVLHDSPALVVAFLACARLGAVAALVNPRLSVGDYLAMVETLAPRLVVAEPQVAEHFSIKTLAGRELLTKAENAPAAPPVVCAEQDPLYIQFTSGTTGSPKGAIHSHVDPIHYHERIASALFELCPEDVSLSVSKLSFAYGFGNTLVFPLTTGGSAVLIAGAHDPATVALAVERYSVTRLYSVPSSYARLVTETDANAFRTLRSVVSAGELLPSTLAERARSFFGLPVLEQLGSTELGHAYCANTPTRNLPGTVGLPVPGYEIDIRDGEGRSLGSGEHGEIWVRGSTVMQAYVNAPDATRATIVDGWVRSRDLGLRREDGFVVVLGRIDDVEVVGGLKVLPHEVEALLLDDPAVVEAAVAAVRNEVGATKLRAFVVPRDNALGEDDLEKRLLSRVRAHLPPFKVPRSITVVSALPKTPSGKLRRHIIRLGTW
jgi:acyl-coenzyme A synthetase/AMP-(fatty) acid ligase